MNKVNKIVILSLLINFSLNFSSIAIDPYDPTESEIKNCINDYKIKGSEGYGCEIILSESVKKCINGFKKYKSRNDSCEDIQEKNGNIKIYALQNYIERQKLKKELNLKNKAAFSDNISKQNQNNLSSLKSNMHTFQTIIETYAVDWGGIYPKNVKDLEKSAIKSNYWKKLENPYDTNILSLGDYNTYVISNKSCKQKGMVIYNPIIKKSSGNIIIEYKIFGCDKNNKLIQEKGSDFYLTNN